MPTTAGTSVCPVATLILLNGPPGIGKSTLSALYVERHPGALNLDIDRLHLLVGGWRTEDGSTHDVLRPVALAMADAHLAGGRDVIVPQYLASSAEIEAFERVAARNDAGFVEIILLADRAEALARFERREDLDEWGTHNRHVVATHGGTAFLGELYEQLCALVPTRLAAVMITSTAGDIEQTYAAVEQAALG